jgi:hypothetical protein
MVFIATGMVAVAVVNALLKSLGGI